MAAQKTIVLITGANGGIGFGLAELLLADATKHILLGSRSLEKGEAAIKDLQSRGEPGSVELLQLDVASEESITAAAKTVETKHGRLDVLVNNAAIGSQGSTLTSQFENGFRTNAIGVFLTVEAFAPLLKKSTTGVPRIINVSSGAGSMNHARDADSFLNSGAHGGAWPWGVAYGVSKAAMNYFTARQSVHYGREGWKVFAYTPGFTVSNLGPHNNAENGAKPTAEGARPMVGIIDGERDGEHGGFLSGGGTYPW